MSLGGDSTLAVTVSSLARKQGLSLEGLSLPLEEMTIQAVAQAVMARGREGGDGPKESEAGRGGDPPPPPSTVVILERDSRTPTAPLRHVGGISERPLSKAFVWKKGGGRIRLGKSGGRPGRKVVRVGVGGVIWKG